MGASWATASGVGAGVVAWATVLVIVWTWVGRPLWREASERRRFHRQFRADWLGEAARDGVDARPGVMAQLERIRYEADLHAARISVVEERVARLERELLAARELLRHVDRAVRRAHPDVVAERMAELDQMD
jgi:hypothetical protein